MLDRCKIETAKYKLMVGVGGHFFASEAKPFLAEEIVFNNPVVGRTHHDGQKC